MRKIVAGLFITLDGVTEAPETWQPPFMSEEVGQSLGEGMMSSDTLLLGRKTYEEWAAFWPGSDLPLAGWMNATPKLVASTTLSSADWQNSTVITGDLTAELTKHKQQPGKDILVSGSTTLVQSLFRDGLLDELRLLVHPIVVGKGSRLFDGVGPSSLELIGSKAFDNGVISARYRPAAG
jgi:dihydrofolate reductase